MKPHLPNSIQFGLPCLLLALTFQAGAQRQGISNEQRLGVILGVLEDHPGNYSGDPNFRVIRAVFQKFGDEWKPFPTNCSNVECLKSLTKLYPPEVTWTIAFDGRNLGTVKAHTPGDFRFYSQVGFQEITSSGQVPTVGKRSEEYSGWLGQPVYRPLVAVSQPYFKDPDDWKPTQLSSEQVNAVRKEFRKKFPKASNCRNPYENKLRPWQYRDEDIKIRSTYSSSDGWFLVQLTLDGWACDGPQGDGSPFIYHWFALKPSGDLHYLGEGGRLVDAGDYDNDGKSEVLFAVGGYNSDGYRLYYADFRKSAEFLFNYH
jgi:hypothetical protein